MNRKLRKPEFNGEQDLEWTAFCYIADELTELEKSEFETRLQDDHQAQQAVVAAMEQSQAIYLALGQAAGVLNSAAPIDVGRRIPGFLFAAAASLILMVAGWSWYASQRTPETIADTNNESERLADAWVYTLVALNESEWNEDLKEEPLELTMEDDSSEDWMYVALTDMEASMEGAE